MGDDEAEDEVGDVLWKSIASRKCLGNASTVDANVLCCSDAHGSLVSDAPGLRWAVFICFGGGGGGMAAEQAVTRKCDRCLWLFVASRPQKLAADLSAWEAWEGR